MVKWKMRSKMAQACSVVLLSLLAADLLLPVHSAERDEAYQESFTLASMLGRLPKLREQLQQQGRQQDSFQDTPASGIVISGGAPDIFAKALLTVKILRKELDCQLPIEVAYYGSIADSLYKTELLNLKRNEDLRFVADLLASALVEDNPFKQMKRRPLSDREENSEMDLRLIDLSHSLENLGLDVRPQRLASLARVLSVQSSAFETVIYLDADTLPLQDPAQFLDWDMYKAHGALFWPDFHSAGSEEGPKETLWAALGVETPWSNDSSWKNSEQGCFVIDRRKHDAVLEWAMFLTSFNNVVRQYVPSYEDVWELAFALAGNLEHHGKVSYPARAAMAQKRQEVYELAAVVQNSEEGDPVFLRRLGKSRFNLSKSGFVSLQWLTVGLPDSGWRAFAYHDDSKSFGIHDESTIYPHHANCDCVDKQTARLLTEKEPGRWDSCFSGTGNLTRQLPVALLPVSNYPSALSGKTQVIERAVTLLQSLTVDRLKRQEMPASPDPLPNFQSETPETLQKVAANIQHQEQAFQADQLGPESRNEDQGSQHDSEALGNELPQHEISEGSGEVLISDESKSLQELQKDSHADVNPVERKSSRALSEGLRSSQRAARIQMRRQRIRSGRSRLNGL